MLENKEYQDFMQAYTKLLVAVWTDQAQAVRMTTDPHGVAEDAGLMIPRDVAITVVTDAGDADADPQVAMESYYQEFQEGLVAKKVVLAVPPAPKLDAQDLNAEDLVDVAGGTPCCCCCPPCCCCWGK